MKNFIDKVHAKWASLPTPSRATTQILAVLLLVLVCFIGFSIASSDRNDIVSAAESAVYVGCVADKENAMILRGILDSQIEFVKRSQEPPPPTVEARVKQLTEQRDKIVVPDCAARASELQTIANRN